MELETQNNLCIKIDEAIGLLKENNTETLLFAFNFCLIKKKIAKKKLVYNFFFLFPFCHLLLLQLARFKRTSGKSNSRETHNSELLFPRTFFPTAKFFLWEIHNKAESVRCIANLVPR